MTKIDDAAVDRMKREVRKLLGLGLTSSEARGILEAALSPEQEIMVSEGMIEAARDTFSRHLIVHCDEVWKRAYRAMESARRKEAGGVQAIDSFSCP